MWNRIKDRVKFIVKKKELNVKAKPKFVSIFSNSQQISVKKGRSHYLLKGCGIRKWNQIEDDNKEIQKDKRDDHWPK